jgi:hypothetical protein
MTAIEYQAYRTSASHGQTALNREALIGIVSPYEAQRLKSVVAVSHPLEQFVGNFVNSEAP